MAPRGRRSAATTEMLRRVDAEEISVALVVRVTCPHSCRASDLGGVAAAELPWGAWRPAATERRNCSGLLAVDVAPGFVALFGPELGVRVRWSGGGRGRRWRRRGCQVLQLRGRLGWRRLLKGRDVPR